MTTIYIVKVTNQQEGYTTADVFSTLDKAQDFLDKYLASTIDPTRYANGKIEQKELDAPDYPFLKKAFRLTHTEDGVKQYVGLNLQTYSPIITPNVEDATVFDAWVDRRTLVLNLDGLHYVNLVVEEV